MTNQTNASLIATAKAMREQMGEEPKSWSVLALWFETADRLEAAEQERDNWKLSAEEATRAEKRWKDRAVEAERARDGWAANAMEYATAIQERDALAAVVEKVRAEVEGESGWFRHRAGRVLDILATAPADALREHEAALIEGLADEIRHKQHAESIRQMLREKARQRREEKP